MDVTAWYNQLKRGSLFVIYKNKTAKFYQSINKDIEKRNQEMIDLEVKLIHDDNIIMIIKPNSDDDIEKLNNKLPKKVKNDIDFKKYIAKNHKKIFERREGKYYIIKQNQYNIFL